jgi:hypothetical protein
MPSKKFRFFWESVCPKAGAYSRWRDSKAALECHEKATLIQILQQKVKRLINAALILGLSVACCACLLFISFSRQISEFFLNTSEDTPNETLPLAQVVFIYQ